MDLSVHILLQRSGDSLEHLKTAQIFIDRGMVHEAGVKATVVDLADLRVALEEQRQSLGDAQISSNPIFIAASDAGFSWLLS